MTSISGMGDTIEDFEVLNLLGKGGFACVYRARSITTGQEVAIKMIDKKLMHAACMVDRVKKEVEIHSRLKHPTILELYSYFEDANYVYLVLEICHNGELYRYLKQHCKILSEDEARHFLRHIVDGLLYLHSHRILHRDLTLANLLLTKDMEVKIADFGLATQLEVPDEKHFTMCGTPNYISPEIAMRTAHGLEADVWSLGCMLYTFLVGRPPFDTMAVKSTLNKVISAKFDIPHHLSTDAKHLIQSLLKKNPKERLSLKEILDHPFMTGSHISQCRKQIQESSLDSGNDTMSTRTTLPCGKRMKTNDTLKSTRISSHEEKRGLSPPVRLSSKSSTDGSQRALSQHSANRSTVSAGSVFTSDHPGYGASSIDFTSSNYYQGGRKSRTRSLPDWNDAQQKQFNPKNYEDSFSRQRSHRSHSGCNRSHRSRSAYSAEGRRSTCSEGRAPRSTNFDGQTHPPISTCSDSGQYQRNRSSERYRPTSGRDTSIGRISHHSNSSTVSTTSRDQLPSVSVISTDSCHNNKSNAETKTIKDIVSQIEVTRLRPIRQKTRNAVVHILDDQVCLEFLQTKHEKEKIKEVVRISNDGQFITVYEPPRKNRSIAMEPIPIPEDKTTYTYSNLPQRYWKKYQYAERFVRMVKSMTPKVTLYTKRCKCMLMENSPDFQVIFHDGAKINMSANSSKIIQNDGTAMTLENNANIQHLSTESREMFDYAQECRQHCLNIESLLSGIDSSDLSCFPAVIGRRNAPKCLLSQQPTTPPRIECIDMNEQESPKTSMKSFEDEENLVPKVCAGKPVTSKLRTTQPLCSVFVPGVGWASQYSDGEVLVQFNDGVQLSVFATTSGTVITYTDTFNQSVQYSQSGLLPTHVRDRLEKIPAVVDTLASQQRELPTKMDTFNPNTGLKVRQMNIIR
ncbi:serine/threonine-protein kinase PLK4-like [Tubulanus polymorphus]|uniref:serine/threonine-protein kinase PLK4-like n=1 Tax=Tubulanus polymorphus TaxID=672921 RepID=UPI003DA63D10